jgi:hypothetical protein
MLRHIAATFSTRALKVDMATCCVLGAVGDVICQFKIENRKPLTPSQWHWRRRGEPANTEVFDPRRFVTITAFSTLYNGVMLHFLLQMYPFGAFALGRLLSPGRVRNALLTEESVLHAHACGWLDNLHCGTFYIPAYFYFVGRGQGDTDNEIRDNLSAEYGATYRAVTAFWVPFMTANYTLVPARNRLQAFAVGNLAWCVIVDHIAHRGAAEDQKG